MRTILILLTTTLLTACTTTKFLAYSGNQQDWPISSGALAEERNGVPVYHGYPPRPYEVLGQMDVTRMHPLAPTTLGKAAAEARRRGADAVIVLDEGKELAGFTHRASGTEAINSKAVYHLTARILLIKFTK